MVKDYQPLHCLLDLKVITRRRKLLQEWQTTHQHEDINDFFFMPLMC